MALFGGSVEPVLTATALSFERSASKHYPVCINDRFAYMHDVCVCVCVCVSMCSWTARC